MIREIADILADVRELQESNNGGTWTLVEVNLDDLVALADMVEASAVIIEEALLL